MSTGHGADATLDLSATTFGDRNEIAILSANPRSSIEVLARWNVRGGPIEQAALFILGQAYRDVIADLDGPAVRAIFEASTLAGKNVAFGLAALVVPEPSTVLFFGLGVTILAVWPRSSGEVMAH